MPQATGQQPPSEDAAPRDGDIADIFLTMRQALGLSPAALAAKLKTTTAAIAALESGVLTDLPEWKETERVVTAYAGLLDLDCRPILRRIAVRNAMEMDGDVAKTALGENSAGLETWQIAAFIAGLLAIVVLVLVAMYATNGQGQDNGGPSTARPAAAPPVAPRSRQAPSGPVTVRRVPLPTAVEGPAGDETVDPKSGGSDNTSAGSP